VEIAWAPHENEGRTYLRITWLEQDGPPVVVPQRRGFGSRLIESGVAAELGGTARLAYDAAGVRCEMIMPLDMATGRVPAKPDDGAWA
jgi:two-component sensor histidine kinase